MRKEKGKGVVTIWASIKVVQIDENIHPRGTSLWIPRPTTRRNQRNLPSIPLACTYYYNINIIIVILWSG